MSSCPLGCEYTCDKCPYCKENLCDYPYIGAEIKRVGNVR